MSSPKDWVSDKPGNGLRGGFQIDNETLVPISRSVAELQNFVNTVDQQPAPTRERELVELAQLPRRWFDRIRELVETESEFVAG